MRGSIGNLIDIIQRRSSGIYKDPSKYRCRNQVPEKMKNVQKLKLLSDRIILQIPVLMPTHM